MSMKRFRQTLFAALVVVAAMYPVANVYAQMTGGPSGPGGTSDTGRLTHHLRNQVEALSNVWRQLHDQNREVKDTRARALLDQARTRLDAARDRLRRIESLNGIDVVSTLETLHRTQTELEVARSLIDRAMSILRRGGGIGGPIGSGGRPVRDHIGDIERILHGMTGPGPHHEAEIRQVEMVLEQARHAEANSNTELARRLVDRARDMARDAWRDASQDRAMEQRGVILRSSADPIVDRALQLAREAGDERMIGIAQRAKEHMQLANQIDAGSRPEVRVRLIEAAIRDAEMVMRNLDQAGFIQRRAERAVAEAASALNRAAEVAGESGKEGSEELLESGRRFLGVATERLGEGNYSAAEQLADQARRVARQVIQAGLGPITPDGVTRAIEQTQRLIDRAASLPLTEQAAVLLNQARERQEHARQLIELGDLKPALAQTRVAARLAEHARNLSD
jgi:hypothetical protein